MFDFSIFSEPGTWMALLTLTLMEVVLGVDNIVFISILCDKLPPHEQVKARSTGIALALILRLGLLFAIRWIMGLTAVLFTVLDHPITGRDLILGAGGLFLIAKATHEIYAKLEGPDGEQGGARPSFRAIVAQILLLDLVFSLDSVITAVGMAQHLLVMVIATVVAVLVMLIFAGAISGFIQRHPSMKMLALSFLLLIGVMLVAESLGQHIDKGYIYFAMGFALLVELINMRTRKKGARPVELHQAPPTA